MRAVLRAKSVDNQLIEAYIHTRICATRIRTTRIYTYLHIYIH